MSERVPIPCENCGRELRIRVSNLGRIGRCKYCGCVFRSRLGDIVEPADPRLLPSGNAEDREYPEHDSGPLAAKASAVSDGPAADEPQPVAEPPGKSLPRAQESSTQEPPEPANPANPSSLAPASQAKESADSSRTLHAELAALRERASEVDQLQQRLRHDLADLEEIRKQLRDAHAGGNGAGAPADPALTQQLDALRGQCERLRDEVESLRGQLESQSANDKALLDDLAKQLNETASERDRIKVELEARVQEAERTRDWLGAERESLLREVEELQNRLEGLERTHDDAEYESHQARLGWDEERQGLETWSERQRQEIVKAERRISELQSQLETEQAAWKRQDDAQAARIAELETRLREALALQDKTARERDDRIDDVERLTQTLAAMERSRAQADADWAETRARLHTEQQEIREEAERQRRELVEESDRKVGDLLKQFDAERREGERKLAELQKQFDAERVEAAEQAELRHREVTEIAEKRLAEFHVQLDAERQTWDEQRDEHAELAQMWESLAQEVEQVQAGLIADRDGLTRELENLRVQFVESVNARNSAETERDEIRAQLENERKELQKQAERQRRELTEEADRKLAALQAQFEAERPELHERIERQRRELTENAVRKLAALRTQFDVERQSLQQQADRQRRGLVEESERKLAALRAQLEAEQAAAKRHRDDYAPRIAELEAQLSETQEVQEKTTRALDQRTLEVARLTPALAAMTRATTEASAKWNETRERLLAEQQQIRDDAERQRSALIEENERKLAELHAQFEAERQAATSGEVEPLLKETERMRSQLDASRRERDAALRQVETLETARRESEQKSQAERGNLVALLKEARKELEAAAGLQARHDEEVQALRADLERQRQQHDDRGHDQDLQLSSLRRDWEVERKRWLELLAAAQSEGPPSAPVPGSGSSPAWREAIAARAEARRKSREAQPTRRTASATALRARPQPTAYHDPEAFRANLESWLAEAETKLEDLQTSPARPESDASAAWLEFEIRSGREEIERLDQEEPVGVSEHHGAGS